MNMVMPSVFCALRVEKQPSGLLGNRRSLALGDPVLMLHSVFTQLLWISAIFIRSASRS